MEVSFIEIRLRGQVIKCVVKKSIVLSHWDVQTVSIVHFYGVRPQEKCGWWCRQGNHLPIGSH